MLLFLAFPLGLSPWPSLAFSLRMMIYFEFWTPYTPRGLGAFQRTSHSSDWLCRLFLLFSLLQGRLTGPAIYSFLRIKYLPLELRRPWRNQGLKKRVTLGCVSLQLSRYANETEDFSSFIIHIFSSSPSCHILRTTISVKRGTTSLLITRKRWRA